MTPKRKAARAAGYLRVSKAREEMQADAIYREQITRYAKAHDLRLVETFEDIGWSGRRGSRTRPRFEAMLASAEMGAFDLLIVPKLSRFGRSVRDNLAAIDRLEAAGVEIAFLDLGVDTSTPVGRLVRNILNDLAEFEADLIADRWRDTHSFLARSGRPSGMACYGYLYDPGAKTMVVNKAEARVVREIFRRYAEGEGLRAIARDLERRGIRGQRGSTRWAPSLGYLLENESYVAMRRVAAVHERGGKRVRGKKRGGELVEGNWPAIVDRALFDRVQVLRSGTPVAYPWINRRGGRQTGLLTGLAVCGRCGGPMWHAGDRYRCANGLRNRGCGSHGTSASRAERIVADAFLSKLSEAHRVRAKSAKLPITAAGAGHDPSAELAEVERKMAKALAAGLESTGEGFDAALRREIERLEQRREDLLGDAIRRAAQAEEAAQRAERAEQLRDQIADLKAVWEKASGEQRREMLALAIERIRVVGDGAKTFDIVWRPWVG